MNKDRRRTIILSVVCVVAWLMYLAIAYVTKDKITGNNGEAHIPVWYAILELLVFSLVFIPLFHRIKHHASLAKMKKIKFAVHSLLVISYIGLFVSFITILFLL